MENVTIEIQDKLSEPVCSECRLGYDASEMSGVAIVRIVSTDHPLVVEGQIVCLRCHFKRLDGELP